MENREKFWVWGYILDTVPGKAPFVDGNTSCSLETAVKYMGCEGAFWMDGLHSLDALCEERMERIKHIPNIIAGLTHVESNGPGLGGWKILYREAAEKISELSLKYPQIKGAVIDDFREMTGPSKDITPEEVHEINLALKSRNPALKLFVVQYYSSQNPVTDLVPYEKDIDGISIWDWVSTDYFWEALFPTEIFRLKNRFPDKEIIQGLFIHDFGGKGQALPMDQLKLQCECISRKLESGRLDGWCALQSGYFCSYDHREQVEYLRNFWNWFYQTRTVLK